MRFFGRRNMAYFLGGILTAIVGKSVLNNPKTRKTVVKTMAKGMKFQKDAQTYLQNVREDAEDLCYEAQIASTKLPDGK